jgi:GNAT superfamily N-acetyltransferase
MFNDWLAAQTGGGLTSSSTSSVTMTRSSARARSIPLRWDGTVEDLPAGIDGAIVRGFEEAGATVLCALVIMVPRHLQGRGVSAMAVRAMAEIARRHGLASLIAPVRPSRKERYPLVPIERYAQWRRPDGLLFDPWMRVHERLGASVLRREPQSLRITGTVNEWETWTQMSFPETGDYWFPGGLATVRIEGAADSGSYWEPNVHHQVRLVQSQLEAVRHRSSGAGCRQVRRERPARDHVLQRLPDVRSDEPDRYRPRCVRSRGCRYSPARREGRLGTAPDDSPSVSWDGLG